MAQPEFTDDERYLINSLKAPNATGESNVFMWGYLVGAVVLVVFAAFYDIMPMMIIAFVVVCIFRIYEDRHMRKWMPLWRSIIEKYELAVSDDD